MSAKPSQPEAYEFINEGRTEYKECMGGNISLNSQRLQKHLKDQIQL